MVRKSDGFTVFELVVSLGLVGLLMGIAMSNVRTLENPAQAGATQITGYLKLARAKAIASTSAYTITAVTLTEFEATFADRCSDADPTVDPQLSFQMPRGSQVELEGWSICFNSRGLPENYETLSIYGKGASLTYSSVEIMLGGAVRVAY